MSDAGAKKVRLDKWLWAARFFKTRSLAKKAIEGGKVQGGGQRLKVSKELVVGEILTIRQGWSEKTVTVDALSDQRRGAQDAALLYTETSESAEKRLLEAEQRKSHGRGVFSPEGKPSKKQRRQLERVIRNTGEAD
ncbi:MAG: RNA-binding S4 domain-containing protein [Pseudomonadales bacterium]